MIDADDQENGAVLRALRWTARWLGSGLALLVVVFVVGEGLPSLSALEPRELVMFAALFAMCAGVALSWTSELAGGLVVLAGFAVFSATNAVATGSFWTGWVIALFGIVGLLLVAPRALVRRR